MAQSYVTDAGTLIIPSASVDWKVQTANSGLSTTGVLMLIGEADAGPRFDLESSLQDNAFGPDEVAAVLAKYGSGPLVDAFRAATAAANDPNITGSFSSAILVKTNASAKAKSALTVHGGGAYNSTGATQMSLADKSYGKLGNLIYYTIGQNAAEVVPTTGAFTIALPIATTNVGVRVNGGAEQTLALSALETPAAFVTAVNGLTGVTATGGASRGLLSSAHGNLSVSVVSGFNVTINFTLNWDGTVPSVGDTVYIPASSVIKGGSNQNVGSYVVTAAAANSISATKVLDATGAPGSLTAPIAVSSVAVSATTDLQAWGSVTISLSAANPIQGAGKALAIEELTTGTDLLSEICYVLGTSTKVSWVSKVSAPQLLVSGVEESVTLNTNRQKDNIQESLTAGGEIALTIGYTGTTATLTITDTTLTTTVVGGSGTNLSINLADFPTISDLATFINSQAGYKAAVGTAILGQISTAALDNVSAIGICNSFGSQSGRVKIDAFRFANQVNNNSVLVQLQDANAVVTQAGSGLPQPVAAVTYLAGGTKGGTADSDVSAGLLALEKCRGNFVVPLISRDASGDVADGLTDSSSTYTLAATHANVRSHVLKMSSLKRARNRQGFLSVRDTFANDKTTSANIASFRCSVAFQDIRDTNSAGSVVQFQPWMGAVKAAAMQAGGFYKAIVRKFISISGALQAAKDFDDQDDDAMETALLAGLLPVRKAESGGWYWVSDQTSYGKDSNFVFNSIQATYAADTVALTFKQRFETAFVGQSVADISAPLALAFLEGVADDLRRLKLIAPSDDAPKGFKNASIKLTGSALIVSLEVKLAGVIYFVPISFLVSQVQQSA